LSALTAGWPGDVPFTFRLGSTIATGASVNVGSIETSVHAGTHCDAPFHFNDAGATVDRVPLDAFLGSCSVVHLTDLTDWRGDLARLHPDGQVPPRLLFRTGSWPDSSRFPIAVPSIPVEQAEWLAANGLRLFGVDLPSVDPLDSKNLAVHHALARHGTAILEGLWLDGVPEGQYELIALPLRLAGADGSPVRAVLRNAFG
jgi:arylformamidase